MQRLNRNNFPVFKSRMTTSYTFTGQYLRLGETLYKNEYLQSAAGLYSLHLLDDGDLVLYENDEGEATKIWSSGSAGSGGRRLEITEDGGNLVILDSDGNIVWSSAVIGKEEENPIEPYAELQDDGGLKIYHNEDTLLWKARKYKGRRHSSKK